MTRIYVNTIHATLLLLVLDPAEVPYQGRTSADIRPGQAVGEQNRSHPQYQHQHLMDNAQPFRISFQREFEENKNGTGTVPNEDEKQEGGMDGIDVDAANENEPSRPVKPQRRRVDADVEAQEAPESEARRQRRSEFLETNPELTEEVTF